MASPTKHTLLYLPFGGRAESIRLTAAIGKVAFSNKVLPFDEYMAMKKEENKLPLGQLPALEIEYDNGEKEIIPQTDAILCYFGKIGGLYPDNFVDALKVDSYLSTIQEIIHNIASTAVGPVKSYNHSPDEELTKQQRLAIKERLVASNFPKLFGHLEEAIEKNGSGWLVGNYVTVADVKLHHPVDWVLTGHLDGIPPSALNKYPNVLNLAKRIEELPDVVSFHKRYGGQSKPYGTFDFDPQEIDDNAV
mmetsp:Transcript_44837/g.54264  ORF Transcript_44837/g.54264 Transcript_44837/m.54264 type:complete len:249 (+) Transcript_44837:65-811(+)|eukprot:CAMPEP_0172514510 /NCGR_PEP_ID=MMETSP1066-20121228/260596_1 /TAXON_ID=671091 /ORGANISM="Coscinodiscus wailesii, Strain CCMP2513" /LENGTH=248 /DNA_ID=CAMNT_0013295201 /DNA_START=59 /DNA_END=805 /DNA_ORIENTATION=+